MVRRRRRAIPRPRLRVSQILKWADAHHARTGKWPRKESGSLRESPWDNWKAIDSALRRGCRGLPAGGSLARLLEERRGVRNAAHLPRLSVRQILKWADAHHERTGRWPANLSQPVAEAPAETWKAVDNALKFGLRGFPGGSSLARVLVKYGRKLERADHARLTYKQILVLADEHHRRTGEWPTKYSGLVDEHPGRSTRSSKKND